MDVVYPLKRSAGPDNELRYSLRSLRNLPHDRVFLVGGRPWWATGVEHIQVDQKCTKYKDAAANIAAACSDPEVSDPFILMNDDFFVMRPIDSVPVLNRGRVTDVERRFEERGINSRYLEAMRQTRERLEELGYDNPWSFELHVPMVVHKQTRLHALDLGASLPIWHARTAYGALAGLTGETIDDVKISDHHTRIPVDATFASCDDRSFLFGLVGRRIRHEFTDRSPYELER